LGLFHVFNEVLKIDRRIPQSAFESETIHFGMKRENDSPPIGVLHFDVASFAMEFDKAHAPECG